MVYLFLFTIFVLASSEAGGYAALWFGPHLRWWHWVIGFVVASVVFAFYMTVCIGMLAAAVWLAAGR